MLTKNRQQVSRALTVCCTVLWLTGSLSVAQGNLTAQWTGTHCPKGQTQNSQHSHNHCTWHCGGLDIQGGGGRDEISTDIRLSRVWSLRVIPLQDAVIDGEFPPRGPPQIILQIA
ncbi:MAG: hypothetical protein JSS39_04025 [Nitrospira sp.]|nr:hypothetical protein [Nitrospira sp.]